MSFNWACGTRCISGDCHLCLEVTKDKLVSQQQVVSLVVRL